MSYAIELVEKANNFVSLPKDFMNHTMTSISAAKNTKCVKIEFKNMCYYLAWDLSINEKNNNVQLPKKLAEINDIKTGTVVFVTVVEEAPLMMNEFTIICENYQDYEVS